jgi:hypothetical protein
LTAIAIKPNHALNRNANNHTFQAGCNSCVSRRYNATIQATPVNPSANHPSQATGLLGKSTSHAIRVSAARVAAFQMLSVTG